MHTKQQNTYILPLIHYFSGIDNCVFQTFFDALLERFTKHTTKLANFKHSSGWEGWLAQTASKSDLYRICSHTMSPSVLLIIKGFEHKVLIRAVWGTLPEHHGHGSISMTSEYLFWSDIFVIRKHTLRIIFLAPSTQDADCLLDRDLIELLGLKWDLVEKPKNVFAEHLRLRMVQS